MVTLGTRLLTAYPNRMSHASRNIARIHCIQKLTTLVGICYLSLIALFQEPANNCIWEVPPRKTSC